ncbi:MAG: divalent-cation tolerance protein CutA [bacterium]|nr:divalent-cation tolerance protein CutA [bacterium]
MILVYITNPTKEEAKKIAEHLIEKKLIACANIFPMESLCMWEGKLADEEEFVLLGKTKEENYKKIADEVEKIHSYDVPCILKISMEANGKYQNWLESELS